MTREIVLNQLANALEATTEINSFLTAADLPHKVVTLGGSDVVAREMNDNPVYWDTEVFVEVTVVATDETIQSTLEQLIADTRARWTVWRDNIDATSGILNSFEPSIGAPEFDTSAEQAVGTAVLTFIVRHR